MVLRKFIFIRVIKSEILPGFDRKKKINNTGFT